MTLNPIKIYRNYHFIVHERNDFFKLMSVILSCETFHHCETACQYVALMHDRFRKSKMTNSYKEFFANIFAHIIMYLQDTAYHSENKYHYSQMMNYTKVTRWPNINDYTRDVLPELRFHMVWERNKNMVITVEE